MRKLIFNVISSSYPLKPFELSYDDIDIIVYYDDKVYPLHIKRLQLKANLSSCMITKNDIFKEKFKFENMLWVDQNLSSLSIEYAQKSTKFSDDDWNEFLSSWMDGLDPEFKVTLFIPTWGGLVHHDLQIVKERHTLTILSTKGIISHNYITKTQDIYRLTFW